NISLVPQALSGNLPTVANEEVCSGLGKGKKGTRLSLDHAFRNIFMGIGFLIVSIALSRSIGSGWWFWLLLPAFSMMGTGVAQFIRLKEQEKRSLMVSSPINPSLPDHTNYSPPKN